MFQFVAVEGFLTPLYDMFPRLMYRPKSRMVTAAVYCAVSFLLGLAMVTQVRAGNTIIAWFSRTKTL